MNKSTWVTYCIADLRFHHLEILIQWSGLRLRNWEFKEMKNVISVKLIQKLFCEMLLWCRAIQQNPLGHLENSKYWVISWSQEYKSEGDALERVGREARSSVSLSRHDWVRGGQRWCERVATANSCLLTPFSAFSPFMFHASLTLFWSCSWLHSST